MTHILNTNVIIFMLLTICGLILLDTRLMAENATEKGLRIVQEAEQYDKGFKIGCFTASSKGNTLLNCLDVTKNVILFASENNRKKIGKYTPGTHIKIISDKEFLKKKIDYAILLSWNYKKFFKSRSLFAKKGGKFIVPLPTPHVN